MARERRSATRQRLAFPVLIEGPFGIRRCIARDISGGGLFVESNEAYAQGSTVRVTFALPDGSWEMTARCTVRHTARLGGDAPALHGVGLAFDAIEEEDLPMAPALRRDHA